MGEELSEASSYIKDVFFCPVCQEVFITPMYTATCLHIFCRKCFLTAMRESGINCSFCHGNVTRIERVCPEWALDLENIMRKFSGSCRCCAKQIQFYCMRHHYKSHKKYRDEYGVCFFCHSKLADLSRFSRCRGPAPADPRYSKERRHRRGSGNNCLITR